MTTLQDRFLLLRSKRPDISNADLARMTGAKAPSVGDWFNGQTRSLKADTAAKVAAVYSVNSTWLATGEGDMTLPNMPPQYAPVVGTDKPEGVTAVAQGTAPITYPPMSPEAEQKLARFLRALRSVPPARQAAAIVAATEALLDHLP